MQGTFRRGMTLIVTLSNSLKLNNNLFSCQREQGYHTVGSQNYSFQQCISQQVVMCHFSI